MTDDIDPFGELLPTMVQWQQLTPAQRLELLDTTASWTGPVIERWRKAVEATST